MPYWAEHCLFRNWYYGNMIYEIWNMSRYMRWSFWPYLDSQSAYCIHISRRWYISCYALTICWIEWFPIFDFYDALGSWIMILFPNSYLYTDFISSSCLVFFWIFWRISRDSIFSFILIILPKPEKGKRYVCYDMLMLAESTFSIC